MTPIMYTQNEGKGRWGLGGTTDFHEIVSLRLQCVVNFGLRSAIGPGSRCGPGGGQGEGMGVYVDSIRVVGRLWNIAEEVSLAADHDFQDSSGTGINGSLKMTTYVVPVLAYSSASQMKSRKLCICK